MGITKITPAQQHILDQMQRGYVLTSHLDTKYRPFNMPAEHGGYLLNPASCALKPVLVSTVKAMLGKKLIIEEKRYVSSEGFCGEHETETWRIHYKLNLCAHCYEAPIADNGPYCQSCADEIGKEYMDEWTQRVGQPA